MKISVIVPIYQVEDFIRDSISSIARQSFKDFEVILVNDGTMDFSIKIAEEVLRQYSIRYKLINQKNKGVSAARNEGIKNSSGDWIICIDPDDTVHKDFLKILYEGCKKNNVDVSFCDYQMVSKEEIWKSPKQLSFNSIILNQDEILYQFLIRKIRIISPSILIRKKLIMDYKLWYDEKIRFSEDQHFIWRTLFTVKKVAYNKSTIYNYLKRENSTMTSSKYEKILTGYYGFLNYLSQVNYYEYKDIKKFILPRWVFGVLRATSKYMSPNEFTKLAETMKYKEYMRVLFEFPDFKIRILSLLLYINWKMFYILNKRI